MWLCDHIPLYTRTATCQSRRTYRSEMACMTISPGELDPVGGGDSIPLTRSPLLIGRRESCDVCLQFPDISSRHCELSCTDGIWSIRDLHSTNGVKVNDQLIQPGQPRALRPGEVVTIAKKHRFRVNYQLPEGASELEFAPSENINIPLLEKAGLAQPPRHTANQGRPQSRPIRNEDEE